MLSFTPIVSRPENLTEQVFQRIHEGIVDQSLAPGERISEASIAALLNVSKTPVREALLRLRHIGLVEQTGTGRMRVLDPSSKTIRDAYQFRATIERSAAHDAAERIDRSAAQQLRDFAQDTVIMANAQTGKGYRDTDRRFHLAVAAATSNEVLHTAVGNALFLTSALREREIPMAKEFVACAEEHVSIARAVSDGKVAAAAHAMSEHILHVMEQVLAADAAAQPAPRATRRTSGNEGVGAMVRRR